MTTGTSIGTAWIQVKPTTRGLRSAIESGLNGTQIGVSVGKSFSSGFAGIMAGAAAKISEKVISLVSSSWSSAVSRVDTLNNFSNVMSNLKIGSEDSQAAINKLDERLTGLPTTLDAAALATQRFTLKTKDVNKASDAFLAVNNALLAGGASAELQSSAMEQLLQAFAKGKPDMVEWRSMLQAMPAQLDQVAKGFNLSDADELGMMLRSQAISMDDFIAKFVELNETGIDGFDSFADQAKKATDTVSTRLRNIQTSITKVIAAAINGEDMSGKIDQLVERVLEVAPQLIRGFAMAFLGLARAIPKLIPSIVDAIVEMAPDLVKALSELMLEISKQLPKIIQAVVNAVPVLLPAIVETIATLGSSPEIYAALAAIFGGKLLFKLLGVAKNFFGGLFTKGVTTGVSSLGKATSVITGSLLKTIGSVLNQLSSQILKPLEKFFGELAKVLTTIAKGLLKIVAEIFSGIGKAIAGFFSALADPAIALGAAMFAVVAAAIAAAILLIGAAIGVVTPALASFMDNVVIPIATFLRDTVLILIDKLVESFTILVNEVIVPLSETIIDYTERVAAVVTKITNGAIIPLINTLSGNFTRVVNSVAQLLSGTMATALRGIKDIVVAIGDGFVKLGSTIRSVLDGVRGILHEFVDLISSVAEALVAVVAVATGRSVTYGRGFAYVTGAATGGIVTGVGTDTSDSNLYALSRGEYVIRAAAARNIGYDNLDKMNESGEIGQSQIVNTFNINGYNKSPDELAEIISRKIALKTQGVLA